MSDQPQPLKLTSLAEWSVLHMSLVFEAVTEEDALRGTKETFPDDVRCTLNGEPLSRANIDKLVLIMRPGPNGGLKVHWKEKVQVPKDPSHRNGSFGGIYFITGLQKPHPETGKMVPFIRTKTVTVKIQSMSDDLSIDSRKITDLVFVASDDPVPA